MKPTAILTMFVAAGLIAAAASPSRTTVKPPVSLRDADDDGYVWLTVGDVNNVKFDGWAGWFEGQGSIPYEYQIAQSEVLTHQYLEFVEGYWPYYDGNPTSEDLTGIFIVGRRVGNEYEYEMLPCTEKMPSTMSLRMAARFCKLDAQWKGELGMGV